MINKLPNSFSLVMLVIAGAFTLFFAVTIIPPLFENFDVIGAFAAGFVNPYSSGYATDIFACWFILLAWVAYERRYSNVRGGWWCILLGIVPGVAVGLACYLVIRNQQLD